METVMKTDMEMEMDMDTKIDMETEAYTVFNTEQ
jgi:hypothetical protein